MERDIPRPQAVLFDLDGTLVDSLPEITATLNLALAGAGRAAATAGQVRSWIGEGARRLLEQALGMATPATEVDTLLDRFRAIYRDTSGTLATLYPGVRDLLGELAAAGVALACVTNKPDVATGPLLRALGMDTVFGSVVSPETVGGRRKPAPDPFLRACHDLGVSPADALAVGDGVPDVQSARAAGIPVAAVLNGYGDPEALLAAGPDWTLLTAADLGGRLLS